MDLQSGDELTFIAEDPPRASWFAVWNDQPEHDRPSPSAHRDIVVCGSDGTPIRRRMPVRPWPVRDAISQLATHPTSAVGAGSSVRAAAAAVRVALDLIGRGRLLPWMSSQGFDSWRVDPLDPNDLAMLHDLADRVPPWLFGEPQPNGGSLRLSVPHDALRSLFDAVGDSMVRTASAALVAGSPVFADVDPVPIPQLRPWLSNASGRFCGEGRLVLHLLPPALDSDDDPTWIASFGLRSPTDPSLVVDAAELWRAPVEIRQRFGDSAERDLLRTLTVAADVCPALAPALDQARPSTLILSDTALDRLLVDVDDLERVGVDVRIPADVVTDGFDRRLVAGAAGPRDGQPAMLDFKSVVTVNWEFLLDGTPLTADELEVLSEAKRPLVPIRGRWVRLDSAVRHRLQCRPPALTAGVALAAALGMGVSVDEHDQVVLGDQPAVDGSGLEAIPVRLDGPLAELAAAIGQLTGAREEKEPVGFSGSLRPYQRQGLAWLSDLCETGLGGCLADDMGLGKTVQVLALHALRPGPTLVVCPTSVLANWEREAAEFLPGTTVRRYHGSGREPLQPKPGDLVLTTYGVVRADAASMSAHPWGLVVADEAQAMKNPRSRTARAMNELRSHSRVALTGTPVENRLSDLWSIMNWVVPGLLGSRETFRRAIAVPVERDNDAAARSVLESMTAPFVLRRRKVDPGIAPELPAKTERTVIVPLTAEQITLYAATTKEALADVAANDGLVRQGLVLKMMTALKQITNHPAHYLGQLGPLDGRSGKLVALDDILDAALESGEATLVFSQFVAMGRLIESHLAQRGIAAGFLHGQQSVADREGLVARFQNRDLGVLIVSLRAGGSGLNLTAATQVVHFDRWWNPAVEDQATDRAHRIGQDQPVTVHRLVTEGTVEDRVAELLDHKRELADRTLRSPERWIGGLSDVELADLVHLEGGR